MKLSKEIKIKVNHKWNWKWISNDFLRHALSDQIQMLEFLWMEIANCSEKKC